MLIKEAMTAPRVALRPDMTVRDAAAAFVEHGALAAPVVDGSGRLVGIVTEIDLLRDRFEPDPRASARPVPRPGTPPPRTVAQVMTRSVLTVTENSDVAELTERMVHTRIRCVPVLREGRLLGMVTRGDLLRVHSRTDEQVEADLLAALTDGGPYLTGWSVRVCEGTAHLRSEGSSNGAGRRLATTIARTVPGVNRVVVDRA